MSKKLLEIRDLRAGVAAVKVVLPWSTWPIVPMLTCGLVLSNFSFAITFCYFFD